MTSAWVLWVSFSSIARSASALPLRETSTRRQPSAAKDRASSSPMPPDAPVTRTVSTLIWSMVGFRAGAGGKGSYSHSAG
jgi:hypothetical protein